jgi:hypothetical protein
MIHRKVRGLDVIFPDEKIMQKILKEANVKEEEIEK